MKSFNSFILEYDAKQLEGANSQQAAIAQKRQKEREARGGKGSEGNSESLNKNMPGQQEKDRRIKQGKNVGYQGDKAIEKRPVTRGTRPDSGGDIVKSTSQLAKTPADKGSAMVRQKQSAASKDAVGKRAPAQKGYMTSPDGVKTSRNSQKPGGPAKPPKKENQFMSGLKTSMGGDVFSKNDAVRKRSRRELGKKTGNAIKSVPGKAVSAGRKALDIGRKSVTQGGEESRADSVQGSSEIIRGKRG